MIYQRRKEGEQDWENLTPGFGESRILPRLGYEYRMIEEPAAPKWPQTTMTNEEMLSALLGQFDAHIGRSQLVNVALTHACEAGQVVPADKVREITAKAYAQGAASVKTGLDRDLRLARAVALSCGHKPYDDTLLRIIKDLK